MGKKNKAPKEGGKPKEDAVTVEGVIVEALRSGFLVEITPEGEIDPEKPKTVISAHLGGKLRHNFIRIVVGDKVKVELSPYDLTQGRITFRLK